MRDLELIHDFQYGKTEQPCVFVVTFATAPEHDDVLKRFFERVQPRGAWGPVAEKLGVPARPLGWGPWVDVLAATVGVYASIVAAGAVLVGDLGHAGGAGIVAVVLLVFAVRRADATPS